MSLGTLDALCSCPGSLAPAGREGLSQVQNFGHSFNPQQYCNGGFLDIATASIILWVMISGAHGGP